MVTHDPAMTSAMSFMVRTTIMSWVFLFEKNATYAKKSRCTRVRYFFNAARVLMVSLSCWSCSFWASVVASDWAWFMYRRALPRSME